MASNLIQPYPEKYTSAHACASSVLTTYRFPERVPPVNPPASRAGKPSRRVSTVIAYADCTHTPACPLVRKLSKLAGELTGGAPVT